MSALGQMIWNNLAAIGQEEKENCIHCNKRWYSMHYRDGVCNSCQQMGKPGRTVLMTRKRGFRLSLLAYGIAGLIIVYLCVT